MGIEDTASDPTAVTVGTSAAQLLADTPGRRRALIIQNTHASNDLYLGFGPNASGVTTGTGIKLVAGDTFTDQGDRCYSGAVYGIASASGTPVRVVEWI